MRQLRTTQRKRTRHPTKTIKLRPRPPKTNQDETPAPSKPHHSNQTQPTAKHHQHHQHQPTNSQPTNPRRSPPRHLNNHGASSKITCALVPLTPKEDTPSTTRTTPHPLPQPPSTTPPHPQTNPHDGEGSSTCNVLGNTPCSIAFTILITPATPAAACV